MLESLFPDLVFLVRTQFLARLLIEASVSEHSMILYNSCSIIL